MNTTQIENTASIIIKRGKKILIQREAEVLVNSNYIDISPNDTKEFLIQPGFIGIFISRKKHLDFTIQPNESKTFVIKEGITDGLFLSKYLFRLFVLIALIYYCILSIISQQNDITLFFITVIFGYYGFRSLRYEYFHLQEL